MASKNTTALDNLPHDKDKVEFITIFTNNVIMLDTQNDGLKLLHVESPNSSSSQHSPRDRAC